ncbi:MAG TPA: putative glycolipid-binding domain-containing protein [Actinomycetota bacterium]|nr:putative glycolipid-binding domain-containing protein [Actinomycetota bacterium]
MPSGRYTVLGDDGEPVGTESFRCAPGPMGWRYFSDVDTTEPSPHHEVIDVVVDAEWRVARLRIATGEHDLLLEPRGGVLTGYHDGRAIEIEHVRDVHLDYLTPATDAVTTKRLEDTTEIDVVRLAPVTLEISRTRQRYERRGPDRVETPSGTFDALRWTVTALDSGCASELWVAGDTVVAYEGLFDLTWYEAGASGAQPLG